MALRLGEHLLSLHDRLLYEPLSKRVRCFLAGAPVCDTTRPALVWETRRVQVSERTDLRIDGVDLPRPVTPWTFPADQARL